MAVGGVGEFEIQDLGVVLRLLQALARRSVLGLGLDDRDGEIAGEPQQVIGPLLLASADPISDDDDAAVGERLLFADLLVGPARGVDFRRDERATGIGFGLRHNEILVRQVLAAAPWRESSLADVPRIATLPAG